jgi:hypothetical protein
MSSKRPTLTLLVLLTGGAGAPALAAAPPSPVVDDLVAACAGFREPWLVETAAAWREAARREAPATAANFIHQADILIAISKDFRATNSPSSPTWNAFQAARSDGQKGIAAWRAANGNPSLWGRAAVDFLVAGYNDGFADYRLGRCRQIEGVVTGGTHQYNPQPYRP